MMLSAGENSLWVATQMGHKDTEMIINCEMSIEMIDPTGEVEVKTETDPIKKWPF